MRSKTSTSGIHLISIVPIKSIEANPQALIRKKWQRTQPKLLNLKDMVLAVAVGVPKTIKNQNRFAFPRAFAKYWPGEEALHRRLDVYSRSIKYGGLHRRLQSNEARAPILALATAEAEFGKILFSNVEIKRRPQIYTGRKWSFLDIATASVVVLMHVLALFAPFTFNWPALWTAVALYLATGMFGITLSFHRNLSHRSFKLPKWLEYMFAYCGVQALQGNPLDWVSTHRFHHQYCDSEKDPHSPVEGFWFSHMSWLFDTDSILHRCGESSNVGDLERQPFYRFLRQTYMAHPIVLAFLLYAAGGFPFLVWGMKSADYQTYEPSKSSEQKDELRFATARGIPPSRALLFYMNWLGVRVVWVYHITWLVNSASHVWGTQSWNTGDLSRNNWWVALLAFGEGWHNNHHAFEYSARHGLEWWELDVTWYVIRLLEVLGLATDVKLPSESQKRRMSVN